MSGQTFQVTINNTGLTISCAAEETILHASLAAGVDYPYACASGNCGACISKLNAGEVAMLPRSDFALNLAQAAMGRTLACRAQPRSDVAITWLGRRGE